MAVTKMLSTQYEYLAKLYLRLKGYLVSNLIIHSDRPGDSKSELDIIAIRLPFHSQEYRWVNVQDHFESPTDRIEIVLGEVKSYSKLERVKFNAGLRQDRESIKQLIDWLGVFEFVTHEQIDKFAYYFNFHRKSDWDGFVYFDEDLPLGRFRFKFTFFCPLLPKWNGKGLKYVEGQEMIDFAWACLNESQVVPTCSRRYDFGGWNELERYVLFFKGDKAKPTLIDFATHFKSG